MSKHAASNDDAPTPKRIRIDDAPLADKRAWAILEQFLTSDMTYAQMEEALSSYLGNRYSADDWKESRDALFSADGDDDLALTNLRAVKAKYIHPASASNDSSVADRRSSGARVQSSRRPAKLKNPYLDLAAEEEEEEEEEEDYDHDHALDGLSDSESGKVTSLPGSSSAARFAAVIDDITNRFETTQHSSSQDRQTIHSSISDLIPSGCSAGLQDGRMYLLHVQRNVTDFIAAHLQRKNFTVKVSTWIAGQLYVVADSPRTIAKSLPFSLYLAVKQYVRISDEEREVVERSCSKLPNPAWVRIKHGKYKGDLGQVFDSDLPNGFVAVLVPPRDFPYSMPPRSRSLLNRSRLPTGNAVSNINHGEEVVGCEYKGEKYYMGLLLHNFHRDRLEHVASPLADDIQLHLQSGWNQSFLKRTVIAFSMQFLHVDDWARIIKGDLSSEIGKVTSTDHPAGSVTLELSLSGHRKEVDVRLHDIERVFRIGDTVRVVAGPYLGVEGHIIQMVNDIFRLCQDVSKEEVEVSKYYLDRRPLSHALQARLPTQQLFKPPPDIESIQIGDCIEVLSGEHEGKCSIVRWLSKGGNNLWFQDGTLNIPVPISVVQRMHLPHLQTLQYTKDRGYDVKPGDVVRVACGPEYQMKGVMRNVDFPNARLSLLSDIDHSLVNVPISFMIKVRNASLDSFKKDIGQEVFIIGGDRKGYQATLYSFTSENCTVAVHGQQRIKIELKDVATRYGMRLNGVMLEGIDMLSFCDMRRRLYLVPQPRSVTPPPEKVPSSSSAPIINPSTSISMWTAWTASPEDQAGNPLPSVNPSSLTAEPNPWTVDTDNILDGIDARMEKLKEGPLAWLKEFSSKFTMHHAMLKVSPSFMGGRLHNRFVSTACPDPFVVQAPRCSTIIYLS
ncbi:hypothetical protein EV424DRAFT_1346538 [Suillus variegatus]|nr:hypothetical protein EV424DRAFT_1346538 [Suillus variegatus]